MSDIKRTERGWPGHFICASRCIYRRNTLLEKSDTRIVVSSVGQMRNANGEGRVEQIGLERYYETMAFHAERNGPYWDADVLREVFIDGKSGICAPTPDDLAPDVDNEADLMHERAVEEIAERMVAGEFDT